MRFGDAGCADEDRDAIGLFVVGVFGPDPEVAEVKAVVTPQHDDGIVGEPECVEAVDHSTDLGIDITGAGVVTVHQLARDFLVDRRGVVLVGDGKVVADFPAAFVGDLWRIFREVRVGCEWQLLRVKQIPILFWGGEW